MELTWTSIAGWLVRAGLGGSLLIVGTLLAMRLVRQPARRQRLGELGMLAALVLAALCWAPAWLPLWEPAPPPAATMDIVLAPVEELEWITIADQPEVRDNPAVPMALASIPQDADSFKLSVWLLPAAVVAYALGAAVCLLRWLAGVVVLWRIVRAAQPATPDLFAALAARFDQEKPGFSKKPGFLNGRRLPRLLISHRLSVPASCGIFRPTLILPAALAAPEHAAERDWVFDHELTHLARRDAWSAVLFALGQTLYFVLPWFWWLKRLVRLCQEYVADAAACRQRPADEYAEFLLSLTSAPAAPLAATGVTGTTSDLYRRVTMLLQNPVRVELSCPRLWTVGAAGVLLGLAVLAAGVGPAQAQPPNQKEVLEQLERIQDMVNKLRTQIADQPKDEAKKTEQQNAFDFFPPALALIIKAPSRIHTSVTGGVIGGKYTKKEAAILEAEGGNKDVLKKKEDQLKLELERAAADHQRALEEYQRALAVLALARQTHGAQGAADKELKSVIELLQKHLADLKDSDAATKKHVQIAIDRLQDALKKVEAAPRTLKIPVTPPQPVPPAKPKPGVIVSVPPVPAVPGQPAAPAIGTLPSTPKPGVVAWSIDDKPLAPWSVKPNAPLLALGADGDKPNVWSLAFAPSQGRLGIRVDAPGALLSEQLNLPKDQGLVIAEVFDNSVAKKAGVKVNDILLKINQQPVSNEPEKLIKQVADIKADTPFDIVVLRRGKQETIQNVRLADAQLTLRTRFWAACALSDLAAAQGAQIMITVKRTKDDITLQRNEGPLAISVHAQSTDGKTKVSSIEVVDKGKSTLYRKVEEVPEPNRAKVQHLLQLLDSTEPGARLRFRYQLKPAPGAESGKDVDLYYRIPKDSKPKSETLRFKLQTDGSLTELKLLQEIPNLNTPLKLLQEIPNLNLELPAELFLAVPKTTEPKKSQLKP